jgi:hypothetical protein
MEQPPYRLVRGAPREQLPALRILFSEPSDELLRDFLAELIHRVCPKSHVVATTIPQGIREKELLETAAGQRFDLAILVLNNVFYPPYEMTRRAATLASDSVLLVEKMKRICKAPVIALYGWPREHRQATTLLRAGAAAAFQLPFSTTDMQAALAQCISS